MGDLGGVAFWESEPPKWRNFRCSFGVLFKCSEKDGNQASNKGTPNSQKHLHVSRPPASRRRLRRIFVSHLEPPFANTSPGEKKVILWMDEILHHLEAMGIISFQGFLRWCDMDFATIHSMPNSELGTFCLKAAPNHARVFFWAKTTYIVSAVGEESCFQ